MTQSFHTHGINQISNPSISFTGVFLMRHFPLLGGIVLWGSVCFRSPFGLHTLQCEKCTKSIPAGQFIEAMGKKLHFDCFRCGHCDKVIGARGLFFVVRRAPVVNLVSDSLNLQGGGGHTLLPELFWGGSPF